MGFETPRSSLSFSEGERTFSNNVRQSHEGFASIFIPACLWGSLKIKTSILVPMHIS